jgi:phenylalanyl-tRNA synthetase beta chain
MPVDVLLARVCRAGLKEGTELRPTEEGGRRRHEGTESLRLTVDELVELLPRLGCEVEEVAEVQEFACRVCGKIYDRTEAQGAPLHCSHCGTDFRAVPASLDHLGVSQVLRLNMLAVRPDIFDPGGMARYIRGFLGVQTGLVEYTPAAPRLRVQVDPQLAHEESYRPHIACAVVRNVGLDSSTIKMVMNLQEDLHWALGRDRKLASIGVYDLDTLSGDVFHYDAVDPDGLRFVPLGFPPDDRASLLTPREILEKHKTGQAYAHLLKPLKKYPLLRDGAGTVLSMPPIINSESTRVTLKTRQFFVDVTGLSQRTVERALNIVVTSLQEIMPAVVVEGVVIEAPTGVRITPDLSPAEMTLSVQQAAETIGIQVNAGELAELLESMGHGVEEGPRGDVLRVLVPAYRHDVMHPVDLIEDAAVAYGYENLTPTLVPTFTVGAPRAIEEQSATARRVFTGLGFHQVMTLVLTSEPAAFARWRVGPDERAVQIDNPISTEQTICRVSLLPGLLETLALNKQYDLPQHLFEVGDCCFVDPATETGAREERFSAAALIGTHVGYADIRAVADAFVHELGAAYTVKATEHPSFISGRVAALCDARGERIGTLGEVHPEIIEAYGLKHAVAVLELSLAQLLGV